MEYVLKFYNSNEHYITMINGYIDILNGFLILGTIITCIIYLYNCNFRFVTNEIENNLKQRNKLDNLLNEYVIEKNKNSISDIAIRFVYWKNYPWDIDDDAYKFRLFIQYDDYKLNKIAYNSWINNTGVNIRNDIFPCKGSIYCDKKGIFFVDERTNLKICGFKEITKGCLIRHIPFKNIVNFDFKTKIEYEPIFYTKYKYDNAKLYDNKVIIREWFGNEYFRFETNIKKQLPKYTKTRYNLKKLKLFFSQKLLSPLDLGSNR